MLNSYDLKFIAQYIGAKLEGNENYIISGLKSMAFADKLDITFLLSRLHTKKMHIHNNAGAVILTQECANLFHGNKLIVADPHLAYAKVSHLFDKDVCNDKKGKESYISYSSIIHDSVRLGKAVEIQDNVVIEEGVRIHDHVVIQSGSVIGKNTQIGMGTKIHRNVTICEDVRIGARCILYSNCTIGSDGFGFAKNGDCWKKIKQLGSVVIGDDVEIGANSCIDRGTLDNTTIRNGVKIDNLVHIAHNVQIGENTAIAAKTGIAGSTVIGGNCTIAGGCGISDHVEITNNVHLQGMSMITKSIIEPGSYSSGTGFMRTKLWQKNIVRLRNLDFFLRKIKKIFIECDLSLHDK